MRFLPLILIVLGLGGCQGSSSDDDLEAGPEPCSSASDADGDGLDDCAEEELGTDPDEEDTDGDGSTDLDELDCLSDPLDAEEACYACGWQRNDPGDLVSDGSELGDVMDNYKLSDQCGDKVDMWDLYGEYHIMYHTAAW